MKTVAARIAFILSTIGIVALLYSVSVFFYPHQTVSGESAAFSHVENVEAKVGGATVVSIEEGGASIPTPPKPPRVRAEDEVQKIVRDQPLRLARGHLQAIGLQMNIPEQLQYGETGDDEYEILFGSNGHGKVGFLLFSTKRNLTADKFRAYFEAYAKDGLDVKTKGKGRAFPNRSGVGEITQFAGTAGRGDEFQAFFFHNKKTKRVHLLVLMDRQLSRHPAQIRLTVDSIR